MDRVRHSTYLGWMVKQGPAGRRKDRPPRASRKRVLLLDVHDAARATMRTAIVSAVGPVVRAHPRALVVVVNLPDDQAFGEAARTAGATDGVVRRLESEEIAHALQAVRRLMAGARDGGNDEAGRRGRGPEPAGPLLSTRERQVLELVARGHTRQEMADHLGIGVKSVETYRARLAEKLMLRTRADLVRYALDHGLLGPRGR